MFHQMNDTPIHMIASHIRTHQQLLEDMSQAPMGKYSVTHIFQAVRSSLNDLEYYASSIREWANQYVQENRATLWLEEGLYPRYTYSYQEKITIWPWIYQHPQREYHGLILDEEEAEREMERQKERQNTPNPNYQPFHPDGCPSGCSCWMLDDMEQWYSEDLAEQHASNNIFFNTSLKRTCQQYMLLELDQVKEQWEHWEPNKKQTTNHFSKKVPDTYGKTALQVVVWWMKEDYRYQSTIRMFEGMRRGDVSYCFWDVWNNMDHIESMVKQGRERLAFFENVVRVMNE
jgi:hypothetical protein